MSEPKITKQDVLEKTTHMLQKQLYVIHTTPTNGLGPVMENIDPHLEFQVKIEQEGIMFAAGPFWADDEETWEGEGMVVIRADNLAHARGDRPIGSHTCQWSPQLHGSALAGQRGRVQPQRDFFRW